jgi:hypothetical protein
MKYRPGYVFAALGLVVVVILAAAVADPTGKTALYVGVPLPILLLFGVLLYQWLWAGSQERPPVPQEVDPAAAKDPGAITDYWQMYRLMAVKPIDLEALARAQRGVMGVVKANVKLGAVVMILPIAAGVMVIVGKVPDLGSGAFLVALPFVLAPLALLWVRLMMTRAAESGGSTLEPLGLEITSLPSVGVGRSTGSATGMGARVSGASVIEGERHGRRVRISLGERHVTEVSGHLPQFEIEQKRGRLRVADGAPAAVEAVLAGLQPSERWRKLRKVSGGPDGAVAERGVDSENGWLWDLWLCERLLAELDRG